MASSRRSIPSTERKCIPQRACAGESGHVVRIGSEWLGWSGVVAHPDAPAGGGGPGHFARAPLSEHQGDLPSPWTPSSPAELPLQGKTPPTRKNPAPVTVARSLGVLKHIQDEKHDVHVDAEILADGGDAPRKGAHTSFKGEMKFASPGAKTKGKEIVSFTSKFVWKGTLTIQTAYAPSAAPNDVSCYGRGTTDEDVRAGDITLGFHESCHRADYAAYPRSNPLPDPPSFSVGMSVDAYQKSTRDFEAALAAYAKDMDSESHAKTDEVGHRLSTREATKQCYRHVLP